MGCGESPMRPPFKLGDLLAAAAAAAAAAVISSKDLCRSSQRSSRRWTAEERLGGRRKGERRCNYFHGLDNYVSSSSAIAGGELSPSCFCTSSSSSCVFFRTFVFAPLLPSFPHPFTLLTYHHTDAIEEKKQFVWDDVHISFLPLLCSHGTFFVWGVEVRLFAFFTSLSLPCPLSTPRPSPCWSTPAP